MVEMDVIDLMIRIKKTVIRIFGSGKIGVEVAFELIHGCLPYICLILESLT